MQGCLGLAVSGATKAINGAWRHPSRTTLGYVKGPHVKELGVDMDQKHTKQCPHPCAVSAVCAFIAHVILYLLFKAVLGSGQVSVFEQFHKKQLGDFFKCAGEASSPLCLFLFSFFPFCLSLSLSPTGSSLSK